MLKHHLIRRTAIAAAAAAALALPVAATTAASAAPAAPVVAAVNAPHLAKNGTAGWELTTNRSLNDISAVITPHAALANIGGVGTGGVGAQFCDPNDGYAAQVGVSSDGTHETVLYQAGNLGTCVGSGVLPNPQDVNTALVSLPLLDQVQVWMSHHNVRVKVGKRPHRHYVTRTKIVFQAQDLATGSEVFSKTIIAPGKEYFDSTGFGIQQDTTGMSACQSGLAPILTPSGDVNGTCAANEPATINATVDGFPLLSLPGSVEQEWLTSAGGLSANPVLVGPTSITAGGTFSLFTGNPTV